MVVQENTLKGKDSELEAELWFGCGPLGLVACSLFSQLAPQLEHTHILSFCQH